MLGLEMTGQISPALCLYLGRPCPFSASLDSDSGRKQQSLCGGALFLSKALSSALLQPGGFVPVCGPIGQNEIPLRNHWGGSNQKRWIEISVGEEVEKLEPSYIFGRNIKWFSQFEK